MNTHILDQLKAENLLKDSPVLTQVADLRKGFRYTTNGEQFSFDDYFTKIVDQIAALKRIELQNTVSPGTESEYLIQLSTALEQVLDENDRILIDILFFTSKVRVALQRNRDLNTAFTAWYSLAAADVIKAQGVKLPASSVKALADSEYSRLLDSVDADLESMLEALKIYIDQLKLHKKVALKKFDLGREQANASWTSRIPGGYPGVAPDEGGQALVKSAPVDDPEDEDEAPVFVRTPPSVGEEPPANDDFEEEPKPRPVGFFKMTTPQPAVPVGVVTAGSPEKLADGTPILVQTTASIGVAGTVTMPPRTPLIVDDDDEEPVPVVTVEAAAAILNSPKQQPVFIDDEEEPLPSPKKVTPKVESVQSVPKPIPVDPAPPIVKPVQTMADLPTPPVKPRTPMVFEEDDEIL